MQWTFPELFREERFLVKLGGLHIEMALWVTMGDFLLGSGWYEDLADAGIALTVAAAISYLRANDPMRTWYAHQITVVVLDSLLKRAYEDGGSEMTFDDWVSVACKEKPTVQFWLLMSRPVQFITYIIFFLLYFSSQISHRKPSVTRRQVYFFYIFFSSVYRS